MKSINKKQNGLKQSKNYKSSTLPGCGSSFSTGRLLAVEDFTFTLLYLITLTAQHYDANCTTMRC